ncbi:MAG: hypothetical protein HQL82_17110, partial [Magnetococcales bacterium]|nr:hypothetical protein [Magnetococcales bacterium]
PNRFQPDRVLQGNTVITIPPRPVAGDPWKFTLTLQKSNVTEEVLCLASDSDLSSLLPPEWRVPELTPLPVRSLDEIQNTLAERVAKVAKNQPGSARLVIPVR